MAEQELPSTATGRKSYKSLKHLIKGKISHGELVAHERLPSMRDLAELYHMSLATVQRALAELCDESVLYSQKGSGTFVAPIQRTSKRLGLLCRRSVDVIGSSMFSPMFSEIEGKAMSQEKVVSLFHMRKQHRGQYHYVDEQDILRHEVDVLILINVVNLGFIASLRQLGFPIIATDLDATDIGVHSVYFDNEASAFDLTQKLIADGHKNIWFSGSIGQFSEDYDLCLRQRYSGYRLALRAHGLKPSRQLCTKSYGSTDSSLSEAFSNELKNNPAPTAIVTETAGMMNSLLNEFNLRDIDIATWSPLTAIESRIHEAKYLGLIDFAEMGRTAYDIVGKIDRGECSKLERKVINVEIINGKPGSK